MRKKINIALALFTALVMVFTMTAVSFAAAVSSNSDALSIALKNAKLKKSKVKLIEVEYDREDGVYEVEFTKKSDKREYSYEITADSGKIVKKSVEYRYKRNSSHSKIGKKAARKKVAKFSGISYKKYVSKGTCYYEYDDGKGTYEVKFKKGKKLYDYEVLAPTGKVISYEWNVVGY